MNGGKSISIWICLGDWPCFRSLGDFKGYCQEKVNVNKKVSFKAFHQRRNLN